MILEFLRWSVLIFASQIMTGRFVSQFFLCHVFLRPNFLHVCLATRVISREFKNRGWHEIFSKIFSRVCPLFGGGESPRTVEENPVTDVARAVHRSQAPMLLRLLKYIVTEGREPLVIPANIITLHNLSP